VIVGSRHPVTLRQVEVFRAARPDCLAPMTTEPSFADRVRITLETFGCCVVVPALPSGLTEGEAAERIARGLELLSGRLPPLGGLTVVGGETFAALCRVLSFYTVFPPPAWGPAFAGEPCAPPSPALSASRTGCLSI
jgi:uncharacterized protein YgbK (DUF1537 family)